MVVPMMLAVPVFVGDAGSAGNICFAAVVGFCWWCLDLFLMPVLGGCSDNIAVPKKTKQKKTHKHIPKHMEIRKV